VHTDGNLKGVRILAQSFVDYLQGIGWITQNDAERVSELIEEDAKNSLYDENNEPPEIKQGQIIVDAGIMTSHEMEEVLFMYKSACILEEYKIALPEEKFADAFIDEYLSIMQEGFHRVYELNVKYGEKTIETALQDEMIIFQLVLGHGDNHFIAGMTASESVFRGAAADLYEQFKADLKLPAFGGTKEDVVDLISEFVNNVNGFCTFKFNLGFDLRLPEFREHAVLEAPRIHVVPVKFLSHTTNLFLVYGTSYKFKKVVL